MVTTTTGGLENFDRIGELLAGWKLPGLFDQIGLEARAARVQRLGADLTALLNQASSDQTQALAAANQQFIVDVQAVLSAKQPPDIFKAQSNLVTDLINGASTSLKTWIDLTQQSRAIYATALQDIAAPPPATDTRSGTARQA